jgi:hypothetical protein
MNRPRFIVMAWLALALLTAKAGLAQREAEGAAAQPGFEAYSIVLERNIFDPNRQPPRPRETASVATPAPPVTEYLDLLGTWVADARKVAFISGSRLATNAQVAPGETIEGWKVESVDTKGIVLAKADRRLAWPVGQRLERSSEVDWRLTERTTVAATAAAPTTNTPTAATPTADSSRSGRGDKAGKRAGSFRSAGSTEARPQSSPGTATAASGGGTNDDVIRKLMERRQREGGQ